MRRSNFVRPFLVVFALCCVARSQADASRRAAEREGAAASDKEPDEEQILARVQRLAKAKQLREAREAAAAAAAAATSTTTAAASAAASAAVPPVQPHLSPPARARVDKDGVMGPDGRAGVSGDGGGIVEGGAGGAMGMGGEPAGRRNEGNGVEKVGRSGAAGDSGRGEGSAGGAKPGSMMAMGIQAFLEESQKR